MPTDTWKKERQQVTFWMEPEEYQTLKEMADKRSISVAGAVRLAILELVLHERAQRPQEPASAPGRGKVAQ